MPPSRARGRRGRHPRRSRSAGVAPAPSRTEERDARARAELEPLREDERPRAVTVAAVGASLFALANVYGLVRALTAAAPQPGRQVLLQVLVTGLLFAIAGGLWRSRYWAVLAMQALLAVQIIFESLRVIIAGGFDLRTLYSVLVVIGAGVLFWFLVKAMARLQMPDRPRAEESP